MNTVRSKQLSGKSGGNAYLGFAVICILFLTACQAAPHYKTVDKDVMNEIQQVLKDSAGAAAAGNDAEGKPSENVLQALVPGLTLGNISTQPVEERFDFVVKQPMDAREFFSLLTEGTEYSIVIHPDISGTISALDLKNVTIQEAMDQLSALYGFSINLKGNIYQVLPAGMQTRIFKVDYLNVNRSGTSNMSVVTSGLLNGSSSNNNNNLNNFNNGNNNNLNNNNLNNGNQNNNFGGNNQGGTSGTNAGGASINTRSEADYWEDLEDIITSIVNAGSGSSRASGLLASLAPGGSSERSVIVSPQTGMIVVRAFPSELDEVGEFLARSQAALQRQVVLEAKILEVTLNEGFQMGIDLRALGTLNGNQIGGAMGLLGVPDSQTDGVISSNLFNSAFPGVSANGASMFGYKSADFESVIRLLETQGNVQVISSPRITTLNNQKAVFKVGGEQYYSTNPTSNTTTGGSTTTSNQNANLQPFFSGIALDVTPQISETGDITLHIHPLLNEVTENNKLIGDQVYPLANSTTRESDSIARAKNGEVVVISGLMQTRSEGNEAGIPGAKDIPVLGNAFGQQQKKMVKTELVILLRAIVDEGSVMQDLIQEHSNSFEDLRRKIDPYYR